MKITRKHIFIISGIIGLIALVVILIKVVNNTSKTCDTSGGKKLYCDGESTVCIDCGEGQTYDCDKGMCVVTCDTSTGNTSYCEDTVCTKCGEGQTYDCVGKKCFCDTSTGNTSYCEGEDTVCTKCSEGQTYDCVGKKCFCDTSTGNTSYCEGEDTVCINCGEGKTYNCDEKKCICDTDYTQCDTICCPDKTKVCIGSTCCDIEQKCNYNDGKYTTCCKPGESCIYNACVSNCSANVPFCGTGTSCCMPGKETCFGNDCVTNCPNNAAFCGTGSVCCPGKYAVCSGSICSLSKCDNGETLYCKNTVCALCGDGQTYDCYGGTNKCICDSEHPVSCGADLCCGTGQTCIIDPTKPNSCCPFGQECGTKNADGSFTSCCLTGFMCDKGKCVQRCGTGDGQYLNCQAGTTVCVKAENLSASEKTQLLQDAKTNSNIVDNTVVCDGNDCSFCVVSNTNRFDPQDRQYPEKVGQLSPGSYIITTTGDNDPGYCTNATITYSTSTDCNKNGLEFCNSPDCKWVSFIPPTTTKTIGDVNSFYTNLDIQFAADENNINKAKKNDPKNDYLGVWKNNTETDLSSNINIKKGVKTRISDCYTIYNNIDDVEKIIFRDTDPANSSSSEKICLALSKFTSVEKGKCPEDITACIYNDNKNITVPSRTGCWTDCASTSYVTGEKWYNQPRQGVNGWSCNPLNIDLTDMRPEDTITAYCPESLCSIKEWMIQDTNGNCGGDERTWDVKDSTLTYIGNQPAITTLNLYYVTINIINKTQKNMACYCETRNYPDAKIYSGRYFIEANSSKKIGVKGAQIAGESGKAPFYIYTCKDISTFADGINNIANFEIFYDSGCSLNNYNRSYSITNTLNIKDSKRADYSNKSIYCGVDIVFYPDSFHTELPIVNMYTTVDLITKIKDIYRLKDHP
jgi:hypothetical protein